MWIHYIGGLGANDKLIAIEIGLGKDPERYLEDLRKSSPFQLDLMKLEAGSLKRYETVQALFRGIRLQGGSWYRATDVLRNHINALPVVDRTKVKTRRVSLLLPPDEFAELEWAVEVMGTKTKNRLARRALRSYLRLVRYRAQGYKVQVIKGGTMVQFNDDLDIDDDSGSNGRG